MVFFGKPKVFQNSCLNCCPRGKFLEHQQELHSETYKINSSPLNTGLPKRKVVFQPSIFRCYVSFREGTLDVSHHHQARSKVGNGNDNVVFPHCVWDLTCFFCLDQDFQPVLRKICCTNPPYTPKKSSKH